jgi:hypothetical protein
MKESDELFQLIHSMSRSEKGYFQKFASGNTDSANKNYIRLFELINDQKEYDEEKIKTRFKNEVFIKQLHVTKNYLYHLILKSLRNFHSRSSIDTQLIEYMRDAELLFDKSLHKHGKKVLVKAKKLAYTNERYPLLLQIIRIEIKVADAVTNKNLLAEEKEILSRLENLNLYRSLSARLNEKLLASNKIRKAEDLKAIDKIISDPLLSDEKNAICLDSKIYFFNIYSNYYELKEDYKNSYNYAKKFVTLLEQHPQQIRLHFKNYLMALNNLCIRQLNLKKYTESRETIEKIRLLPDHYSDTISEDDAASIFITLYSLETDLDIKSGVFRKITGMVKDIENGLKDLDNSIYISYKMAVWFNVAYLYFGTGEYKKALPWLNKIINTEETGLRKDIQACARLVHLLIHYELEDMDTLNYIAKSIERFFYKGHWIFGYEKILLDFIRKLSKADDTKQLKELFIHVKEQLLQLEKNPQERISEYFDFISWLDSKINKIPFQEAYRKRQKI